MDKDELVRMNNEDESVKMIDGNYIQEKPESLIIKAFKALKPECLANEITQYLKDNKISSYSVEDITYDKFLDRGVPIFIAYLTYQPERDVLGDFDENEE